MTTIITKLEAARRSLAVAVRLFFDRDDPVAVHTLAAAAQGVIRDLARARNLKHTSLLHDHPEVPPQARAQWARILNSPRNFFKHADNDPCGTLDFEASSNEILLLDACLILSEVSNQSLSEASVYLGWFTTAHPELRGALSNNQVGDMAARNHISPENYDWFRELCGERILVEPVNRG
jgi:hypothetical protein